MNDDDVLVAKLQRSARSVARLSSATRIVAIAMLVVAAFLFLYGVGRADRHFDDFIGFSLVAIATTALALVFWSTAAFHAAFGSSTALLTELHMNVERMAKLQREQHERPGAAPRPATLPAAATATTALPAAAPAAADPTGPTAASASKEGEPTPAASAADADAAPRAEKKRAKEAAPPAPKPPPDPVERTCKRCGSDVREGATRCRICLEKV